MERHVRRVYVTNKIWNGIADMTGSVSFERIAPIFIDHQAEAHRMLADAIDAARAERLPLVERRRRAIGQGARLEPLTEAEYYEMVAQLEGRADTPGSAAKPRKPRARAVKTATTPDLEPVETT